MPTTPREGEAGNTVARGGGGRGRLTTSDLAYVAYGAALIAVLGLPGRVELFGGAVPITGQSLGVMLVGAVLGGRRGAAAAATFLALVAVGLPLLAGGRGGLGVLAGPSAGYLLAFPIGAYVCGRLAEWRRPRPELAWLFLSCVVGGIVVIHAVGAPVLAIRAGLDLREALLTGTVVFLPGDLLKAALAASIAVGVHRALPRDRSPWTAAVERVADK